MKHESRKVRMSDGSERITKDALIHPSSFIPPPSKRLGQNFLTDQRIIQRIVEALEPRANETIVEIGPGRGALTAPLLERAGALVAIEFDQNLIPLLTDKFSGKPNFKL